MALTEQQYKDLFYLKLGELQGAVEHYVATKHKPGAAFRSFEKRAKQDLLLHKTQLELVNALFEDLAKEES